MGVWCGVCAGQLDSAVENFGGFKASLDFHGWQVEPERSRDGHVVIADTCASCAAVLRAAVAKAANRIAKKHAKRVEALHEKLAEWERQRRERDAFEREFDRKRDLAWMKRQEKARPLIEVYGEAAYLGHFAEENANGARIKVRPWSRLSAAERKRWESTASDVLDAFAEDVMALAQQANPKTPFGSVSPGLVRRRRGET